MNTLTWIDAAGDELELTGAIIVGDGPVGLDSPPVALSTAAQAAGDGSMLINRRWAARPIAIPLVIATGDRAAIETDLRRRMLLGPGQLRSTPAAGEIRTLHNVIYESGLEGDESSDTSGGDWSARVVSLLALDPWWYGPAADVSLGPPEGDFAYDANIDYDADIPYDGAAAGIDGGLLYDANIDYDADIPYDGGAVIAYPGASPVGAWPTITVRGPASNVQIVHLRTGEILDSAPGVMVPAGREMVIVCRPGDRGVWVAGVESWGAITAGSSLQMMLRPAGPVPAVDASGHEVRDALGRVVLTTGVADRLSVIVQGTSAESWVRVAWEERWPEP